VLISIVYDCGFGHTAWQATAVAEGARTVAGATIHLLPVLNGNFDWKLLEESDAIIFGSPTYNGSLSARLRHFFEDSTKAAGRELKWRDKIAAGFTNSGAHSGDKLQIMISMALFAVRHGMIWVGLNLMPSDSGSKGSVHDLNRLGSWLGAMAQSNVDEGPEITPIESDRKNCILSGKARCGTERTLQDGAQERLSHRILPKETSQIKIVGHEAELYKNPVTPCGCLKLGQTKEVLES
jgi:NAD(P)H dehydrogenase (quinone)